MVVLQIFTMYNMGNSFGKIVDFLAERGIPSPTGKPRWNREDLGKLLRNEKYAGQVRLQKNNCAGWKASRELRGRPVSLYEQSPGDYHD